MGPYWDEWYEVANKDRHTNFVQKCAAYNFLSNSANRMSFRALVPKLGSKPYYHVKRFGREKSWRDRAGERCVVFTQGLPHRLQKDSPGLSKCGVQYCSCQKCLVGFQFFQNLKHGECLCATSEEAIGGEF
ncbi:hypothetical protein NPIL_304301 [Nephila pilipes]|uniref:Uncharacterized protein n=1 Tax=Nephila pilipes TaxID=299642 RepID=A0A8X6QCA5_NEPPI|nr:hypothetical protein NPIL_304301 [Nephila pilipes]